MIRIKEMRISIYFLMTFSITIIILLFLSLFMYHYYNRIMIHDIEAKYEICLSNFQNNIDIHLESLEELSSFIERNSEFQWFVNSSLYKNISNSEASNLIKAQIENLTKASSALNSIYFLIWRENKNDFTILPDDYISTKINWNIILEKQKENKNYFIDNIDSSLFEEDSIIYTKKIEITGLGVFKAYIVFIINKNWLIETMNRLGEEPIGFFTIQNEVDDIIISNNNETLTNYNLNKHKYRKIIKKSNINDWQYVYNIPYTVYDKKIIKLKAIIIFSIIFAFCLAIFNTCYFLRKHIDILLELYNKVNPDKKSLQKNEVVATSEAIDILLEENIKNKKIVEKQKNCLIKENLLKILDSPYLNSNIQEHLYKFGINFNYKKYLIAIYKNHTEKIQDNSICFSYNKIKLGIDEYYLYNREMNICIYNYSCNFTEITSYIENNFKNNFSNNEVFNISISSEKNDVSMLKQAYKEALIGEEYATISGKNIVYYNNAYLENNCFYNVDFYNFDEKKYLNYMISNQYDSAFKIISKQLSIIENNILSITAVRYYHDYLVTQIVSAYKKIRGNLKDKKNLDLQISHIISSKSLINLKYNIKVFFEFLNKEILKTNLGLVDKVKKIIKSKYYDVNLSTESIARKLGISMQYASIYFRRKTGIRILDYIHQVRIEKAKILLKKDDIKIKQIAEKIGYYNDISLIRAFKRYEGITPGEYKKIIGK